LLRNSFISSLKKFITTRELEPSDVADDALFVAVNAFDIVDVKFVNKLSKYMKVKK
jgi:hypothetical protein